MLTRIQALFVMAKGPHCGHSPTATGLRYVFRHHRQISGVATAHLHVPLHSFGTALAEAGAGLLVLQALMGQDYVDSSAAYIHLAPAHVRAAYDPARAGSAPGRPLMPLVKRAVTPQAVPIYDCYLRRLAEIPGRWQRRLLGLVLCGSGVATPGPGAVVCRGEESQG